MTANAKSKRSGLTAAALLLTASATVAAAAASPTWLAKPSADDLAAAYPDAAFKAGRSGRALISCAVGADGYLSECDVRSEEPSGLGFGRAALEVGGKFRLRPGDLAGGRVSVPVRFDAPPPEPPLREAVFETPKGRFKKLAPAGPYWPDLALRRGAAGYAAIDCQVASDDTLKSCEVVKAEPSDVFFGDAALMMARRGWMKAGPLKAGATPSASGLYRFLIVYPQRTYRDARG